MLGQRIWTWTLGICSMGFQKKGLSPAKLEHLLQMGVSTFFPLHVNSRATLQLL